VLFADLKGSMELLADRDPEEARKILDPVLQHMMEAVHHYEGTVNQVMGDGIMALFGAPLAHEDHAVRACYAALRMQESVKRYADGAFHSFGLPIQIRVGLNSGEVVVRAIGSDLHMDYTAVGQSTHLAARMEQLATASTTLLTMSTLGLAEGRIAVEPRGLVPVKGLADPVEVFELTGAGPARARFHAAGVRGLTRFVGRDAEMEQLRRALALVGTGHGQIVAVVGEPGVGKSRLFYEFTRSHQTHGCLVLESSSASYGKAPYLPVVDLLKSYLRVQGGDEPREIREKVTGKLLALDESLRPSLTPILALLDVPIEEPRWQGLEPTQRKQLTLDAVRRVLLRESQVQPLVLAFEDLHWIDSESQALLDTLVESLPSARVLLLVNYRPEFQHPWGGRSHYTQLRIDPLPLETAEELLASLLGSDPAVSLLKRQLIERTEGNPFYIEESVRTLVETQALVGERGAYRSGRSFGTFQMPPTVQAILASRVDRLPAEDKRLLQTAAVVGKDVPFPLLQAVAEIPDAELRSGLGRLQGGEFLYEATLFPELEYTFKHALTHEVTYGTLLQDRRKALHARIADAIERGYPDRLAEHVERLAHHAFRAEMWEKAVTSLRQAGAKALARSANREAATCFEQALAALGHLPETRETLEQALDLRFDLRFALVPLGAYERVVAYLREAERLARKLGDQRRLGQLSVHMCQVLVLTGHPTEAIGFGQNALNTAESLGDVALQVGANLALGGAYSRTGDYRRAEDLLLKLLQLLDGDPRGERSGVGEAPIAQARSILSLICADRGSFTEAIAHGQEGLRLAEALDNPTTLATVRWYRAHVQIDRGELHQAVGLAERGRALAGQWNLPYFAALYSGSLGYTYALLGRTAEGIPLLEHAISALGTMGHRSAQERFTVYLGEACVLADRLEDALEFARRALAFARERGQRGYEALALRLLGEATARREPPERADGHYRDALALAEALGMRPLVAHCHLGLGKLYRRTGKREQAREHLTTAMTMYREMGMTYWLEKAAVELQALA
jgi:class 3 adenylate cyclase/tetratricopeptide (TPR) repeat protein